jgi:hypothetical protein
LKAYLDFQDISVTKFAASLGTSPQGLMDTVVRWAGRAEPPKHEATQKIMAAVDAKLAEYLVNSSADMP